MNFTGSFKPNRFFKFDVIDKLTSDRQIYKLLQFQTQTQNLFHKPNEQALVKYVW